MKKNELINKTLAGLMIAAMTAGVCPTTAFAVTGAQASSRRNLYSNCSCNEEQQKIDT